VGVRRLNPERTEVRPRIPEPCVREPRFGKLTPSECRLGTGSEAMRDAVRAVAAVLGTAFLLIGGRGILRGQRNALNVIAAAVGVICLLAVVIIPPGKPDPPLYDDDW